VLIHGYFLPIYGYFYERRKQREELREELREKLGSSEEEKLIKK
jgi:hypothetical protein